MTASKPPESGDGDVILYTYLWGIGKTIMPAGFSDVTPDLPPPSHGHLRPKHRIAHALSVLLFGSVEIYEEDLE